MKHCYHLKKGVTALSRRWHGVPLQTYVQGAGNRILTYKHSSRQNNYTLVCHTFETSGLATSCWHQSHWRGQFFFFPLWHHCKTAVCGEAGLTACSLAPDQSLHPQWTWFSRSGKEYGIKLWFLWMIKQLYNKHRRWGAMGGRSRSARGINSGIMVSNIAQKQTGQPIHQCQIQAISHDWFRKLSNPSTQLKWAESVLWGLDCFTLSLGDKSRATCAAGTHCSDWGTLKMGEGCYEPKAS